MVNYLHPCYNDASTLWANVPTSRPIAPTSSILDSKPSEWLEMNMGSRLPKLSTLLAVFALVGFKAAAAPLPTPSPQQYVYHEQERIAFVCLDPATWQGREYDNHSTPLGQIKLPKLDTDQWCRAA